MKTGLASDDLYLKGQGYDAGGKPINFDESFGLEHGLSGARGITENRWQLTVFESGGVRIGEIGMGHGDDYGDDDIYCDRTHVFDKNGKTGWRGDQWEKAIASVKFKLTNCDIKGSRRKCNIEIADGVGLKESSS